MSNKEFKVGDRVEFTEDYTDKTLTGTRAVITEVLGDVVGGTTDAGVNFSAFPRRLKLVEAQEQEPEAQPVTYRICVGSNIGTTEYLSLEAAKEAALQHGNDKEEFSIFEVVKIADYRVKVEKSLEAA
jgi:hypothetical protein